MMIVGSGQLVQVWQQQHLLGAVLLKRTLVLLVLVLMMLMMMINIIGQGTVVAEEGSGAGGAQIDRSRRRGEQVWR